jgi:2-dehydropantoate 2-reductase
MTERVLVLGAGGIGGLLAAKLSANPVASVVIGVRHDTPPLSFTAAGQETHPPVEVVRDPCGLEPVDWVVVATKAYDVPGLSAWLESPVCRSAVVAVAQNGVEQVERLGQFADASRVLPLIVTYGAERRGPGRIVETLAGVVRVPAGEHGKAFVALAGPTELRMELVEDFATALWEKLAWNLVGNSLSAISDVPVREIGLRPELRWLAHELVSECRAAARAQGAHLPESLVDKILDTFAEFPDTVRSSMWQDRHAGRPFEHDVISGAVVRTASRAGLLVPYSQMATKLLETISPAPRPA